MPAHTYTHMCVDRHACMPKKIAISRESKLENDLRERVRENFFFIRLNYFFYIIDPMLPLLTFS